MNDKASRAFYLVPTIAMVATSVFAVLVLGGFGGEEFQLWLTDIGEAIPPLIGAALGLAAAARLGARSPLGVMALLGGLALLSWGLGELAWSVLEVGLGLDPYPSVADAGFLAFYPLVAGALVAYLRWAPVAWRRTMAWGVPPVAFTGAIVMLAVLLPQVQATEEDILTQWVSLAYPMLDAALLVLLVPTLIAMAGHRARTSGFWLLGGVTTIALADLLFSSQVLATGSMEAGWPDVFWFLGFVMGLAGFSELLRSMSAAMKTSGASGWHRVSPGSVHIVTETQAVMAQTVARQASRAGGHVLYLSGHRQGAERAGVPPEAIVWVSELNAEHSAYTPTKLSMMTDLAQRHFAKRGRTLMVLDCLDRLLVVNSQAEVMRFVSRLTDLAGALKGALLISYDPRTIDPSFAALLERGSERLEPVVVPTLMLPMPEGAGKAETG